MSAAVVVLRIALAAVFGAAGWAKFADVSGTRQAARDFGVPAAAAPAVAFVVPLLELAVAVLLVLGPVVVGAAGALILLGVFTVAVATSLARGRRPDCHCFGRLQSERVSSRTLVRNGILLVAAAVVLARG